MTLRRRDGGMARRGGPCRYGISRGGETSLSSDLGQAFTLQMRGPEIELRDGNIMGAIRETPSTGQVHVIRVKRSSDGREGSITRQWMRRTVTGSQTRPVAARRTEAVGLIDGLLLRSNERKRRAEVLRTFTSRHVVE